jgi:ABC-type branched-subunit amino acid transport system substrate-binding protein
MIFQICHSRTEVLDTLGKDAEYIMGVTPWTPNLNSVDTYSGWSSGTFNDRYYEKYHSTAPYIAASTFASAEVLLSVIESTQSLDVDMLKDALENDYFETFFANITFDQHNQASFDMLVVQVRCHFCAVFFNFSALSLTSIHAILFLFSCTVSS